MNAPRISSDKVWCIYSGDTTSGGPAYIKHSAGLVLFGFGSSALAQRFLREWQMPEEHQTIEVAKLGTTRFPNQALQRHVTDKVLLINTLAQLRAYAQDREGFSELCELRTVSITYDPHKDTFA